MESFYEYLTKEGYLFDKETIENYLLSLKVKPFTILTGNSGTGKTKLSQLFASYISTEKIIANETIDTEVTVGKSYSSNGWSLKREDCDKLMPIKEYENEYKIKVDGINAKGKLRINPRLFYSGKELKNHLEELATNDPKQKISMQIELNSEENSNSKSNYKIIPVGANWTENRNIIGYYNLITEEYQSTPAYELIKEAIKNPEEPHFLILDEMNLSHVERYFADFLSAIESGEEIPLYGIDESLKIPNNLFIIGTVNVDETTYMFSPKVLDRANTIEFETFPADRYMFENYNLQSPEGDIKYLEDPLTDLNLKNMKISEIKEKFQDVKVDGEEFWTVFTNETYKFQEILKQSGFEFGFRVINEITRFMYVAWKYEGQPQNWVNWYRYFDAQIKQKMLPKLHGSEKIIGDTLEDLKKETENKYPSSNKKLEEMLKVLEKQRYVSFIN